MSNRQMSITRFHLEVIPAYNGPMKILLVDDDSFLIDMYAAKFTSAGHEVDTAKSVEQALEKVHEGGVYDAMLLDMVLPGLTGIDFLNKVREENLLKDATVIMLSNQGDQADIDRAMKEGAGGYIIKAHMIPSEVVAKVEELVKKK